MEDNLQRYDTIKSYILGNMTKEEQAAFEKDLKTDAALREEYELTKGIAEGVVEQAMSEAVALEESIPTEADFASITDSQLKEVDAELELLDGKNGLQRLKQGFDNLLVNIKYWFSPTGQVEWSNSGQPVPVLIGSFSNRMALSFAAALAVCLLVFVPGHYSAANAGYNYAIDHGSLSISTLRGEDDVSDLLSKAVNEYNKNDGDLISAESNLDKAKMILEERISMLSEDVSDMAIKAATMQELYTVDWYKALVLMREKKVHKAKVLLRSISKSESPYSKEARRILKNIY